MRKRHYLPSIFEEFDELCNAMYPAQSESKNSGLSISEDKEKIYIDAPLPGVKPEDVEVTLDPKSRSLKISGSSKEERKGAHYHVKGSSSFFYEIPLSNQIDLEAKVDASSSNGVLTVTLIKSQKEEPIRIDVRS